MHWEALKTDFRAALKGYKYQFMKDKSKAPVTENILNSTSQC